MFAECESLTELDLSSFNTPSVTDMGYMFYYCFDLTSLDFSNGDMSSVTDATSMFYRCTNLTNFKAPKNIGIALSFSNSTNLTHDSLMSIINNLATVSSSTTLTLGYTNLSKLTDEEKAIATGKGWTLA
jgi:surface protein